MLVKYIGADINAGSSNTFLPNSGNYWCPVGPCYPLHSGAHNVSPCLPPPPGMRTSSQAQAVVRQQQPPPPSPAAPQPLHPMSAHPQSCIRPRHTNTTDTVLQRRYCEPVSFILYLFFVFVV